MPTISVTGGAATEANNISFLVTLSEASLSDVTVQYRVVQDGSAELASDFFSSNVAATRTLTILAGQTQASIETGSDNGSSEDEQDENFTLELSDPVNATFASGAPVLQATGVFLDNDGSSNDRALFVSDPILIEGDSGTKQAVFEIRLSDSFGSSITLNYQTADGTAVAGSDYTATSGSVTFLPGQTVTTVAVDVIGDTLSETAETFSLVVEPTSATFNGTDDAAGIATILADDAPGAVPVISVQGSEALEANNNIFVVSLSEPSLSDVTVEYRIVQDGSAELAVDFFNSRVSQTNTLTILAGETQATIEVGSDNGSSEDERDENFTLELSDPVNAVLGGGQPVLQATGVFLDNDGSTNDRALFVSDPILLEGDSGTTQAVFEIRLSEPFTSAITLSYQTADGTARAGSDYTAASGSVTFLPGQTVASVAVDVRGDTRFEAAETFSLVVAANPALFNVVDDAGGIATILADDGAGNLPVISVQGSEAIEANNNVFVISLSEKSLSDVTVQYRMVQDGSADLASDFFNSSVSQLRTLTIPAGQTQVTVETGSDNGSSEDERDENFAIELTSPVNATFGGGQPVLKATGIFLDNDGSTNDRALFVSDPVVVESDGGTVEAVFEIQISEPFSSAITLNYQTTNGTAIAGQDYTPEIGSVTFLPGQTIASVAVDVTGDVTQESTETFSLVVTTNPALFNGVADANGTAEIRNFSGRLIEGTPGPDRLIGSALNDTIFGFEGADFLSGGPGADTMNGGLGNDFYVVDNVGDQIVGEIAFSLGGGIDTVRSFIDYVQPNNIELVRLGNINGTGNLNATGNDAPGTLVGNAGNNILTGRGGNDQLNGNGGDDTITGNTGRDTLVGGAGDDTFVYTAYADSRAGGDARDLINGFDRLQNADDVIDLRQLDANTRTFGVNDAFEFIGAARFSGQAGELRYQGLGGPNAVIVEADHNGDRVADLQIFVNLTTFMTGTDFLL